jgi:hypothetical protein
MLYSVLLPIVISFSVSADTNLSLIRSNDKRTELFNILHSEDPDHYSRLWFVGFLKYVGYSLEEICAIIDLEASWSDYDATMTYCQVRSVFKGISDARSNRVAKPHISSPSSTWIKRGEWEKRYGKRLCTIHFVSCAECPDNPGAGLPCRGRI